MSFQSRLRSLWDRAWRRKSLKQALKETRQSGLKRVLDTTQITLSGIGFVLGSGIFVLTGTIAAKYAGPAACLTFILAAIPAALSALCYAEMVTLIPGGGGAFTYTRVGLGELPGFLVGWMLSLAYVVGCALVGVGWAAYVVRLCRDHHLVIMEACSMAPWRWDPVSCTLTSTGAYANLPAAIVILAIAFITYLGARDSVRFTAVLSAIKLLVIVAVIVGGASHVDTSLWHPFIPANAGDFGQFGYSGVLQGVGVAMFAYLGVDNICTAAQEAQRPQESIPRAILITLCVCGTLYVLVSLVLTGLVPYASLDVDDPIAVGTAATGLKWLLLLVQVGSIAGLSSVLLMQMYGLPRILFAMAKDGLAPQWLGKLHGPTSTPVRALAVMAAVAALCAALLPVDMLSGVASNGTMLTFIAVSLSVIRLKRAHPKAERPFAVPFGTYAIPVAAIVTCALLIATARAMVIVTLAGWVAMGVVLYAWMSWRKRRPRAAQPAA